MKYDYLVVGAGLFGAVFAQQAKEAGKTVLVIERREHIAGNAYTETAESIEVHKYGAHIFHTDDAAVWSYVNRFAKFNDFVNSPLANYHGEIYPLPFNMNTFKAMWGVSEPSEAERIINEQRKEIKGTPQSLQEQAIASVGRDVFEKLIKGYTEKQWGRPCSELPPFIIKRIPVRFTYNNNYFNSRYQGIPVDGYTRMTEQLLEGIELRLGVDYLKDREAFNQIAERTVFSGAVDEYFGYCLGHLEYRSLRFENEVWNKPDFQGNAVVNYTDGETPWTRIIEHKWFAFDKNQVELSPPKTVISREYSAEWKPGEEPYYPVNDERNNALYLRYSALAVQEKNVFFGGRLGSYKYYDMDKVIAEALKLSCQLIYG